jgi:diguanylate cyclase (GGDEF)-like protein
MRQSIVFRGESYARTSAERDIDEPKLGEAIRAFFDSLELPPEKINELRSYYRDAVRTAISHIRNNESRPLTAEEKVTILNRALATLVEHVAGAKKVQEFADAQLIPELLQKSEAEQRLQEDMVWLQEDPKAGYTRRLVVVHMDLDDFKILNDTYGHTVGDAVLRQFGKGLFEHTRPTDKGIHFSGDEFGIFMRLETTESTEDDIEQSIVTILRRIITQVHAKIQRPDHTTQGISVGFTVMEPATIRPVEVIYAEADEAVSQSKIRSITQESTNPEEAPRSEDRIISFRTIEQINTSLSAEETFIREAMRALKRSLRALAEAQGCDPVDLSSAAYEALQNIIDKTRNL